MRLREVQAALRDVVLGRDDRGAAAVVAGDGLAAEARLGIYRHHVAASLADVLAAAFPVVRRLVDPRFFAYAAHEFVRAHPPASPCLFEYGAGLPAFLAEFPPCAGLPYLPDVARLEWALHAAAHADDAAPIDPAALAAVPPEATGRLRLALDPARAWLDSPWPADAIWLANQPGADAAAVVDLDSGGARLEVGRVEGGAGFRPLDAATFAFRVALGRGEALEAAADCALAVDRGFDLASAIRALLEEGAITGAALPSESAAPPA